MSTQKEFKIPCIKIPKGQDKNKEFPVITVDCISINLANVDSNTDVIKDSLWNSAHIIFWKQKMIQITILNGTLFYRVWIWNREVDYNIYSINLNSKSHQATT